jgi:hypothetical protein
MTSAQHFARTKQMCRVTRHAAMEAAMPHSDTAGPTIHLIVRLERFGHTRTHPHRWA